MLIRTGALGRVSASHHYADRNADFLIGCDCLSTCASLFRIRPSISARVLVKLIAPVKIIPSGTTDRILGEEISPELLTEYPMAQWHDD